MPNDASSGNVAGREVAMLFLTYPRVAGDYLLLTPYSLLITTFLLLTPYRALLTPYSLPLTPYSLLLAAYSLLLTPYSLLLTHHSLLFTHYHLLLTTDFLLLLLTSYYLDHPKAAGGAITRHITPRHAARHATPRRATPQAQTKPNQKISATQRDLRCLSSPPSRLPTHQR